MESPFSSPAYLHAQLLETQNELEQTRFEASVAHHEELFTLLLFPGALLIGLEALLRALLLRRFP